MKYTKLLAIVIVVALIMNCAKKEDVKVDIIIENGIKTYVNSSPADTTAVLNLKKLFTISGEEQHDSLANFNQPVSMTVDKSGNIYVLDRNSLSLKKFDDKGDFIKSIGRRGKGPGELQGTSYVLLLQDTLVVLSKDFKKLTKFNIEGEYISEKHLDVDIHLPQTYDSENIIGFTVNLDQTGNDPTIEFSLSLLDNRFNVKKDFSKNLFSLKDFMNHKVNVSDVLVPYTVAKDVIFMSENDDNLYKINIYDLEANLTSSIKKDFRRIKYTEEEKEEFYEYKANNERMKNDQAMQLGKFKKAFIAMFYDKYGRLLVVPEVDKKNNKDGSYIDIFKDGVYLNRVSFDINKGGVDLGIFTFIQKQIFFFGERVYVINTDDITVDVYDY